MATKPTKPPARRSTAPKPAPEPRRRGRPPTPVEEQRTQSFHIMLTAAEHREILGFAKTTGLPAGTWARQLLLEAARQE